MCTRKLCPNGGRFNKGNETLKKLFMAGMAATLTMAAAPAFAESTDTESFTINATVAEECSIGEPSTIDLDISINTDPGADALLINTVAQSDVQNIWMSCNYPAAISLSTVNRKLLTSTAVTDTDNFTNFINYGVRLWPSDGSAFAGFGSWKPRVQPQGAPKANTSEFHDFAELSVRLEDMNVIGAKRPVAGVYTDIVTITLGAT